MDSSKRKGPVDARVLALIACLLWATPAAFLRNAMGSFTPLPLGLFRLLIASAALIVFGVVKKIGLPKLRDVPYFLLTGFIGFGGYFIIFNTGTAMIQSGLNAIILASSPVFVAIIMRIRYREVLSARRWIAIGIELAGLVILVIFDGLLSLNLGVLYIFCAAIMLAIYSILQRTGLRGYSPIQFTAYSIVAGTLFELGWLPELIPQVAHAQPFHILLVFCTAIFTTIITYMLWGKALEIAPRASDVTNFMFLTPFFATLVGWALNGEVPTLSTVVGGVVVLVGVALFNAAEHPKEESHTSR